MNNTDEIYWLRKIAEFMRCLNQVENGDAKDMLNIPLEKLQDLAGANDVFLIELKDAVTAKVTHAVPGPAPMTMIDPVFFNNIAGTTPMYFSGKPFPELNTADTADGSTVILPLKDGDLHSCVILIWHEPITFSPAFKEFMEITFSVVRRLTKVSTVLYSIEQLEAYFNAIMQTVPQSIIFIDNTGSRSWVNESAAQLLGVPAGIVEPGLLANSMQSIRSLASNREEIFARGMELFKQGRKVTGDWKWIYSDPEPRVLNVYCTPVDFKSIQGMLWMFDDITEKHFSDQEIHGLNHKLKLASDYKSQFLANMSHELRSPLNSIIVLANLLSDNAEGNYTTKQLDYAKIISGAGKDLLYLINDILDLAKIEAGKMDFNYALERTRDIVQSIQGLFTEVARSKNINFSINVATALPESIMTDRLRLGQILKNLLSNAFKFTPEGGTVIFCLDYEPAKNWMIIRVSDTGIGIDTHKKNEIFEAFEQADGSTTRNFGGTGLGLSISKELVSRFGGCIAVESALGAGSTFTVTLPLEQHASINISPMIMTPVPEPEPTEPEMPECPELQLQNILVATADIREVFLFDTTLTNCGVITRHAASVETIEQEIRSALPDVLVLDLDLLQTGNSLTTLLEQHGKVKVLALAATGRNSEAFDNDRFDTVLQRPVHAAQLLSALKDMLKTAAHQS